MLANNGTCLIEIPWSGTSCGDGKVSFEPHREKIGFANAKTKAQNSFAVTAKLNSAFVFTTRIVPFIFLLKPKFQACSLFLKLSMPVYVRRGRKLD